MKPRSASDKMPNLEDFGFQMRLRRKELHMTAAELAEKLGYSKPSRIYEIESGFRDISITTMLKIAEILDCSPSYLLRDDEPPTCGENLRCIIRPRTEREFRHLHNLYVYAARQIRTFIETTKFK